MHGEPDDALRHGRWFVRWIDRPESPLRVKWLVIVGAVAGVVAAVGTWFYLPTVWPQNADPMTDGFLALLAGWGAFCVVSLVGIIAQALIRLSVYGPEWSVNRAAIRNDFPLCRTWVGVVEVVLIVATTAAGLWWLADFIRYGSRLSLFSKNRSMSVFISLRAPSNLSIP